MNRQAGRPSGGHRQGMRRVTAICWLVASSSWLGCAGEGTAPDLSANRAPESARRLPTVAQWWLGGPVDLPVRPYFTDPDGDSLAFSLEHESPASSGLGVSLSRGFVTITPGGWSNMTSVRVTVADPGGLTAEQQFEAWSVGTTTPPANPNVPRATEKIPSTPPSARGHCQDNLVESFLFLGTDGVRSHALIGRRIHVSVGRHANAGGEEPGTGPGYTVGEARRWQSQVWCGRTRIQGRRGPPFSPA